MTSLTEFLSARLDEMEDGLARTYRDLAEAERYNGRSLTADWLMEQRARVLADVEAKRAVVELHTDCEESCEWRWGKFVPDADPEVSVGTDWRGELTVRQSIGHTPLIGCVTLLALAQPYRDHPDFDPNWL